MVKIYHRKITIHETNFHFHGDVEMSFISNGDYIVRWSGSDRVTVYDDTMAIHSVLIELENNVIFECPFNDYQIVFPRNFINAGI